MRQKMKGKDNAHIICERSIYNFCIVRKTGAGMRFYVQETNRLM